MVHLHPLRAGHISHLFAGQLQARFLADSQHLSNCINRLNASGISVLIKKRIARDLDRVGQTERTVRIVLFRNPASEVMSLNVDPGGSALTARLTSGSPSSFCNAFQSFALILGIKVFGSNDGTETIARMLPLFGSTTTAPARLTARNASSAIA